MGILYGQKKGSHPSELRRDDLRQYGASLMPGLQEQSFLLLKGRKTREHSGIERGLAFCEHLLKEHVGGWQSLLLIMHG
ncbi:hypothetical protein KSD_73090 [Ktedonobacter sp. SOSP1-85]|nr:hypothetical protein KSD_73090 [Ktedonobacter sp. SOSP1-85]